MSEFQFSISGFSTNPNHFQFTSRDFNLIIDNPKYLIKTYKGDNPIEFILSKYARCICDIAYLSAQKLSLKTDKISIKMYGHINPELLLENSYAEVSEKNNLIVELSPKIDASEDELALWISIIEEYCFTHPHVQYIIPTAIHLEIKSKLLAV